MEKAVSPEPSLSHISGTQLAPTPRRSLCFENAAGLVESALGLIKQQPGEVVMDLGEIEMIDSSGVKALLHIRRACEDAGVGFKLGSVSDTADRIIGMSKLNGVFGIPYRGREWGAVESHPSLDLQAPGWKTSEYRAISDPAVISGLREKAIEAAVEAGVCGDALCDIQIAVGEALTNAYKHGSPKKGVDQIHLRCMSCPAAVVIEVQDEGEPFDTQRRSAPDLEEMRDHGMGIYLMHEAMDLVEFQCECPGNRVRMFKWLCDGGHA